MSALPTHLTPLLPASAHRGALKPLIELVASKKCVNGQCQALPQGLTYASYLTLPIERQENTSISHAMSAFPTHSIPLFPILAHLGAIEQACCLEKELMHHRHAYTSPMKASLIAPTNNMPIFELTYCMHGYHQNITYLSLQVSKI